MSNAKTDSSMTAATQSPAIKGGLVSLCAPPELVLAPDELRLVVAYRDLHIDVQRFMLAGMEKLRADPITARPGAIADHLEATALRLVGGSHA